MGFFLVTTEHLANRLWFRDAEDFRAAMNFVAIVSITMNIDVLAFILMSNHVHFVLECDEESAKAFITELKKQYSRYFNLKYGTKELLRRNKVSIQELDPSDESLERAIAYTVMNCVAANICANPFSYSWGTGDSYFRSTPSKGRKLGTLPGRRRIRLLHSEASLPDDLIVSDEGYILPESYVKVRFVESVFQTPKRMLFFLNNSSKAKHKLAAGENNIPSFRDQVVASAIPDLCRTLFGKNKAQELNRENLSELFRQIRFRFSSSIEQIARTTGFSSETVTHLLDNY